jgi:hypothetical protein
VKNRIHLRCQDCKSDVEISEEPGHESWNVWCPVCNRNISRIFWIELDLNNETRNEISEMQTRRS